MSARDTFISWLKDAYTMEVQIAEVLERHSEQAQDYPQIAARVEGHLAETRTHADRVRSCLESLGEDVPALGAGVAGLTGMLKGFSDGLAGDTLLNNTITQYTTESFEIARYNALALAAAELGEPMVAEVCQSILEEEVAMSEWLEENMPMVVEETLAVNADDEEAVGENVVM